MIPILCHPNDLSPVHIRPRIFRMHSSSYYYYINQLIASAPEHSAHHCAASTSTVPLSTLRTIAPHLPLLLCHRAPRAPKRRIYFYSAHVHSLRQAPLCFFLFCMSDRPTSLLIIFRSNLVVKVWSNGYSSQGKLRWLHIHHLFTVTLCNCECSRKPLFLL